MAWFSRRRSQPAPTTTDRTAAAGPPDADDVLPMLSRADAAWLADAVAAALGEAGCADIAQHDGMVVADGTSYGLHNLAVTLTQTPRADWPGAVRRHVTALVESRQRGVGTLEEVADLLVARVLGQDALDRFDPAAGYHLADDLVVVASIDYPETVATLMSADELGGWDVLGAHAMAGLRRLPPPEHATLPGAAVHVFESDDLFGASRLLVLDELLAASPAGPAPHGVLVAVPDRHLILVHVLRDASVVEAVQTMAGIARSRQDGPGPVSPNVYFRGTDGALQRITDVGPDGLKVRVEGAFADAFAALGLIR